MADAAGLGLDQDLARTGRGDVELLEHQRLAELLDLRNPHFARHAIAFGKSAPRATASPAMKS